MQAWFSVAPEGSPMLWMGGAMGRGGGGGTGGLGGAGEEGLHGDDGRGEM